MVLQCSANNATEADKCEDKTSAVTRSPTYADEASTAKLCKLTGAAAPGRAKLNFADSTTAPNCNIPSSHGDNSLPPIRIPTLC
mmetsp:Transcript_55203/g.131576  ORF Transcript_55203/g.131576 Transcript_55203/m.131576 type:complete len:84 (-) Transcript_55203:24-275(-)